MLFQMFLQAKQWLQSKEEGQTLVEYALIIVLIAIVVIVALIFLGDNIRNILNRIGEVLGGYPPQ